MIVRLCVFQIKIAFGEICAGTTLRGAMNDFVATLTSIFSIIMTRDDLKKIK